LQHGRCRRDGRYLDTILQRLSQYIEKIVKLRAAVRSAMVYPVAVILIAIGVVWIILWKVIPDLRDVVCGLGAQLPLPTRITIALSKFIGSWWWLVFLMLGWESSRYSAITRPTRAVVSWIACSSSCRSSETC
jgi:type II secretory pathway component PulF